MNLDTIKLQYRIEAESPYNDGYTRAWYQQQLEALQQPAEDDELPPTPRDRWWA